MVKVSIIIPVYNAEKYLRKCLDSAINQTLKDIEVICVNDASTDNSLALLNQYKDQDPRVKIIDLKENSGVGHARNEALKIARGEFIGFIDSDDWVDPSYFSELYSYHEKYDIIRGIRVINLEGNDTNRYAKNPYGCIIPSIIRRDLLIKRHLKFPEQRLPGEDSTFKRWLYLCTRKIFECPNKGIYYHYIKREGSLSNYDFSKKPLVSVILTLYEIKPEYLNECINSLLNQTHSNIEIIAINDCSPNINYDYLYSMSPKIKLYKNPVNLGMNKTVNKAFNLAKGKYLVRLGSDDFFDPHLIEKEVAVLEKNPEAGAVCCELKRFGEYDQHIKRPLKWDYRSIIENKRFGGTGYAGGMMFRKELLKNCSIDESLKMCEDFDFHLQILYYMPILSIHEVLYYYRAHDTNLCRSVRRTERLALLDKIIAKHQARLKNE